MSFKVGDTKCKPYCFDAEGIIAFARNAGDMNPLHHDADAAAASRFGRLIASGAHMSAVLMGFGASMLTDGHDSLGLEFCFKFLKAIPADTMTTLMWTISEVTPNPRLGGDIIACRGEIVGADGSVHVTSTGKAVVWDKGAQTA